MDINELYTAPAHEDGAEMQVRHPVTGALLDCYISVKGRDSKAGRQVLSKMNRLAVEIVRGESNVDEDEKTAELLADMITGWRGLLSNGKALEYSKAQAKELLINSPPIREQINAFISSRANFIKS